MPAPTGIPRWTDFTIWTWASVTILTAKNWRAINWIVTNNKMTKHGFQPFWPNRVIIYNRAAVLEILSYIEEDGFTWRELL